MLKFIRSVLSLINSCTNYNSALLCEILIKLFIYILQIYEGTAQIQRLIISREHLGKYKN